MKVPNRNRILESLLSGGTQLGEDRSTMSQTVREQQQLRGEREIETSVSVAAPQNNTNRAERRQKERVTEVYVPDESEKVDTDGIYDVPSSVLRSIQDTIAEEQGSEYDQLIPVSAHSAKIADESQRTLPSQSGWGYAEIKDVGPSAPTATAQVVPSNQDNTHSTSMLQYADITEAVPSKQAPVIKPVPNYTHDMDSTIDVHGSLIASFTPWGWDGNMTKECNIEEQVVQASVVDRETPTGSTCHELKQSSEISEPEDGRNTATPEGSEGSDVFIDQPPTSTTTKSNSLPPRMSHRIQSAGGGNATISPQRGISMKIPSPKHNRPRIVSEPQPTTKPRPAKRTRISNDPTPQDLPEKTLQVSETQPLADIWASQPETPPPALPEKPQPPPILPEKPIPTLPEEIVPVLPEKPVPMLPEKSLPVIPDKPPPPLPDKPSPVLPEKPPPVLPEKPSPPLPDKPSPVLPDKPPPALPEKPPPPLPDKPPPVLPDKPPPELPEKPPPVIPENPVWEKPVPPIEQPTMAAERFDTPTVGKPPPKLSERPPVPKPRRHFQSTSSSTPTQVRSSRSHTTATCNTVALDSPPTLPSTHQTQVTNGGSPKAFRSTRAKSSSDSQRLEIGNGSGAHGRSPQHSPETTRTVTYENAVFFKGKAKAAAPPVARKPKHTPTSSPGPAFNRREHSGPPTTPKPKRN